MTTTFHKEIERAFILKGDISQKYNACTRCISDIYFGKHIRVRRMMHPTVFTKSYILTIKFDTDIKYEREEYEWDVPAWLGKFLFKYMPKQMHKERTFYTLPVNGRTYTFEVNKYLNRGGYLKGLVEIEFYSEQYANDFNPTDFPFLGQEVTGVPTYRNYNLFRTCKRGVKWHA